MKRDLVTDSTDQAESYLAELLLAKPTRSTALFVSISIRALHHGDLSDGGLRRID